MRLALVLSLCLVAPATAQEVVRTELTRAPVPGSDTHEVIVSRLEIEPGATVPRHFHNGDEHLVVIQGGEMKTASGDVIPFPSGMAAHFAAGIAHGGLTNGTDETMIAITTHVVEIGKPLSIAVE